MGAAGRALPREYDVVEVLGAGACGEVLLARHVGLGRLVAAKRLHSFALDRPEALERFRREAVVLAAIDDRRIVRLYDFTRHDGDPLIVMEYVDGPTLATLLASGPMRAAAALRVLSDVAGALAVAAGQGIAHRDVKPANVFVLADGSAKLGDFGLARVTADAAVFRTSDGSMSGTPAYLAPEVILGDEPDERADAYSFAVMSYETLTGRRPFDGSVAELLGAQTSSSVPDPSRFVSGFPSVATAALIDGLRKDPSRRLLPAQLMERLRGVPVEQWPEPVGESQPAYLADAGPEQRTVPMTRTQVQLPSRPARRRRPGGGRRIALVAAIGASLVGAGTVAALVSSRRSGQLTLDGVEVAAAPAVGRCPAADFTFTATLTTRGSGGRVLLQWTQPDGRQSAPIVVVVPRGRTTTSALLKFRVTGNRPLAGAASVTVLEPTRRQASSSSVHYVC